MAELTLTFQDLYNRVSKYLGTYGDSGPSGTDLTDAKDVVHEGYRRFITAYQWSFTRITTTLSIESGTWEYDLPEGFREVTVPFRYSLNTGYPPIENVNIEWIMQARAESDVSGYPQVYAIRHGRYSEQSGSRYQAIFWPEPDNSYTLYYTYLAMPPKLENDDDEPVGGSEYAEAIKYCCLAAAEVFHDETVGVQSQIAMQRLNEAILNEKGKRARHVGANYDPVIASWQTARGEFRANRVTYNIS